MSKKNILYIVENTTNAQFRYRCANIVEAMHNDCEWSVNYVLIDEINGINFNKVSLLIIERQTSKNNQLFKLIKNAHKYNVKVLFDLDDLIFDYKDLPVLMASTNSKNIIYWLMYFWGIRRIAKKVDGFLTTNEFLGKQLKKSLKKEYKVIPNSLNKEQIKLSENYSKNKHKGFLVGYFSGSPTHTKDFKMIEPSLIRFLENYQDVKLIIVGYMQFSKKIKKFMNCCRIEHLDFMDYKKLQTLMSDVDVNIAPLVINKFTHCKSELKFFEAAIMKTTTIASPTYAFKQAICDKNNGLLARQNEWYAKLEYLYLHPQDNKRIADKARLYVKENFYGEKIVTRAKEAYGYFTK